MTIKRSSRRRVRCFSRPPAFASLCTSICTFSEFSTFTYWQTHWDQRRSERCLPPCSLTLSLLLQGRSHLTLLRLCYSSQGQFKSFLFSLVCSLLLLLLAGCGVARWRSLERRLALACSREVPLGLRASLRVTGVHEHTASAAGALKMRLALMLVWQLHDQFVLNLIEVHLDVVTAHFLLPSVLEVEVLILSKFSTAAE